MNFNNKKTLLSLEYLLTIVVAVIILALSKYIFAYYSVNSESLYMPYISTEGLSENNIFYIFTTDSHSWFFVSMFHVFINKYLPLIFNIHPQICMNTINVWFLGIIFTFFIFALAFNISKYLKIRFLNPIYALLVIPIVLFLIQESTFIWIFLSNLCWFLSYIFQAICPLLLLQNVEYFYVTKEKITKKQIIIFILLLLICGAGHEFFRFIILCSLIIAFFLDWLFIKEKRNVKRCFLVYSLICTINFLLCFTQAYKTYYINYSCNFSLSELINYIPHYLTEYNTYILKANLGLFIILLCSLFVLNVICTGDKQSNKRFYIIIFSYVLSAMIFEIVLIHASLYQDMVKHIGMSFLFKILLLNCIISSWGYILKYSNRVKPTVTTILLVTIFTSAISFYETKTLKPAILNAKNIRANMYILEKFYLINRKYNTDIYNYYTDSTFSNYFTKYLNNTYRTHFDFYNPNIYNICSEEEGIKVCQDKMLKLIKEKVGYEFSKEELEKMDFQALYELE